jgi:hypothetical protein
LVGSSIRVTPEAATVEGRGDHTEELRGHVRIEHDRQTSARRLRRTEEARRTVDRFARRPVEVELVGRAPHGEAEPGLCLGVVALALVGERRDRHVAAVLPARHPDAGRGGDRRLAVGICVVRVVDADARIRAGRQLLEVLGQVDLVVRRVLGQLVVPQRLRRDGHSVRLGERRPLVDGAELHVVPGLCQHLCDGVVVERPGVRETGPAVTDHPDADAFALRGDEVLDIALVDPDLGFPAARHEGLDLLTGPRLGDDPVGDGEQLALERRHAVPPTVSDLTRSVG